MRPSSKPRWAAKVPALPTLKLEGKCSDKIAKYVGTAEQVPGVLLEGTLILSEGPLPAPEANEPIQKFNPAKLPKLPKRPR
jgi:hypothetical protein